MGSLRHLVLLSLAGLVLSGCATSRDQPDAQVEIDRLILDSARTIQASQAELFRAGALNRASANPSQRIFSDGQPLTFTWKGDAYVLLQALASDRGYLFQVEGLRLPLPLNLDVKDQAFTTVLESVRAQVGYRATVSSTLGKLTLSYHTPQL